MSHCTASHWTCCAGEESAGSASGRREGTMVVGDIGCADCNSDGAGDAVDNSYFAVGAADTVADDANAGDRRLAVVVG